MSALNELVQEIAKECTMQALAIGWLRYEHVRTLSPSAFAKIVAENLSTGVHFDVLVDAEIERRANEK